MAEPVNAATASAANDEDDDADDLYGDLDEQVAAALAAAGESGGSNAKDSDLATDAEGEVPGADANEAVDLGDCTADYSSSDEESDDGLQIVLNEDAGAPLPPPPPVAHSECYVAEDEDGEDLGVRVKGPTANDSSWGKCRGLLERTTVPVVGQGDGGRQHLFRNDINFFLPRNSTIFDMNIEAFQLKPWRQHGVNLTDYFNFGLDEQGWRKYWLSMKQVRQGSRTLLNVSSDLGQESCKVESVKVMPKEANYSGYEGRNGLAKPKGRAIRVEDSVSERVPSADMWRPMQRDSDVVIQVNVLHSPSNQSTSDDSSTLNHRHVTTGRISIDHHGDRHLKDSSFVVGRVVDKEMHAIGSSEYAGNKLYRRDSACAKDRSPSPGYSGTLSEESEEDLYFKRAKRHSDPTDFYEDTKLMDEHVKSDLYYNSSESDHGNSKKDYLARSYTPSVNGIYQQADKLLVGDEDPFSGQGRSTELFINCKSSQRLRKSAHKTRTEQKRRPLHTRRCAAFDGQDKSTDNNHRRCVGKYEQEMSNSILQRKNYHNAVHDKLYGKQDYPHLKRTALRNDEHYLNDGSNDHHGRSFRRKFSEDVVEGFTLGKEWQRHHDNGYDSMLEAEVCNGNDGHMYRERYYEEMRTARNVNDVDDEFLYDTDYRFRRSESPDVRARYSNRGSAKTIDVYMKPHDSRRDWPAACVTSTNSRNRCIEHKRMHNAKMVRYHYDGYHQKEYHSFCADSIPQSALSDTVAETSRCILPVKRKLHAHLGSMNHKDINDLSFPKGRKIMHDKSVFSDRKNNGVRPHNSSKEFYTEATFCSNDITKCTIVSNTAVEAKHELGKGHNILLKDRKIKFRRRGNQLIREVEIDSKGCLSVGDDLHGSKHKDIGRNMRQQNKGYGLSGNQDWEESTYQKRQNEDAEIEEGELIEQDEHNIVSKGKLSKPKKVALKSVISVMSEDAACNDGATIQCDNKRILELMAKMQKRRERFKEAITTQKGNDGEKKELLSETCNKDDMSNQRPARKRLWGGGC